ncbi:hypothetical protein BJV85_002940 [Clostridium acetobutylicum]|nr:hypothetical protein [Clostridium acetobutylicum]NRY57271.1 hypothetical protein [Clostridium acetobutylicum]NSA94017.1 hypothetical protein [Clostridium acetobutylicum]NYC95154.1 hypothetical protein [Clostridium acetobutylicum]
MQKKKKGLGGIILNNLLQIKVYDIGLIFGYFMKGKV